MKAFRNSNAFNGNHGPGGGSGAGGFHGPGGGSNSSPQNVQGGFNQQSGQGHQQQQGGYRPIPSSLAVDSTMYSPPVYVSETRSFIRGP